MAKKKIKKEYSQPQKFLHEKLLWSPISPTRKSPKDFLVGDAQRQSLLHLLVKL